MDISKLLEPAPEVNTSTEAKVVYTAIICENDAHAPPPPKVTSPGALMSRNETFVTNTAYWDIKEQE